MPKNSREYGQRFEREARDRLKVLWPDARRGLQQATGARECDVEGTPLRLEIKSWSKWPQVEAALDQVRTDAQKYEDSRPRAVLHKRKNKTDWRITMELDEFIRLMQEVDGEYTVEQYIEDEIPERE